MHTSAKGRAFLRSHEGDVLKAYRCPAGKLTIGVGLTAASGVVKPTPGMVITRALSDVLLTQALDRNYEPGVSKALGGVKQHVFDGAVSFHFNTGAIARASWVKKFLANAGAPAVRAALNQWTKGAGRVMPGLVRRRREEADIILNDRWPAGLKVDTPVEPQPTATFAVFVIRVTADEIEAIRQGFRDIGFDPGPQRGEVFRTAVENFQHRFGLTRDGKIGRATLSTLQRELDARSKAKTGGATIVGGGSVAGVNEARPASPVDGISDVALSWIGGAVLVAGAAYCAWLAWTYRDVIAARLTDGAPRLANWLRSF